ncbi:hypothetical protein CAPTEDRAFT_187229 [Capitella teleta]|uniref:Uncharacterized protein n=1 Tax=Capitella teleta TaxID=283909 RepID=X1ZK23_CAPTE|nr:hypothetical protein CAPTEDRAFT_187229 [Capitella teleta]|eukprot:ELU10070.1 hypothetical protein CAPTEDRAFT_187229 [Capitella teleta]
MKNWIGEIEIPIPSPMGTLTTMKNWISKIEIPLPSPGASLKPAKDVITGILWSKCEMICKDNNETLLQLNAAKIVQSSLIKVVAQKDQENQELKRTIEMLKCEERKLGKEKMAIVEQGPKEQGDQPLKEEGQSTEKCEIKESAKLSVAQTLSCDANPMNCEDKVVISEEVTKSEGKVVKREIEAKTKSEDNVMECEEKATEHQDQVVKSTKEAKESQDQVVKSGEEPKESQDQVVKSEKVAKESQDQVVKREEEAQQSQDQVVQSEEGVETNEGKGRMSEENNMKTDQDATECGMDQKSEEQSQRSTEDTSDMDVVRPESVAKRHFVIKLKSNTEDKPEPTKDDLWRF